MNYEAAVAVFAPFLLHLFFFCLSFLLIAFSALAYGLPLHLTCLFFGWLVSADGTSPYLLHSSVFLFCQLYESSQVRFVIYTAIVVHMSLALFGSPVTKALGFELLTLYDSSATTVMLLEALCLCVHCADFAMKCTVLVSRLCQTAGCEPAVLFVGVLYVCCEYIVIC